MDDTNTNKLIEFMKKEWDFSWAHIDGVKRIYWTLFLSLFAFNGVIIKFYLEKNSTYSFADGLVSLFVLSVNTVLILIYQREHYAQEENYFSIHLIRKKMNSIQNLSDWNHFFNKKFDNDYKEKYSLLDGLGYKYYLSFKFILGISVPFYIFLNFIINSTNCFLQYLLSTLFLIILIILLTIYICKSREWKRIKKNFDKDIIGINNL